MKSARRVVVSIAASAVMLTGSGVGLYGGVAGAAPVGEGHGLSTPAGAGFSSFPTIYQNWFWPNVGVRMEFNTLFNAAQTRDIARTGIVPALAGTDLPYSGIGRWLDGGELQKLVSTGGCFAVGIRRTEVLSPVTKKKVAWAVQTYRTPGNTPRDVAAVCETGGDNGGGGDNRGGDSNQGL